MRHASTDLRARKGRRGFTLVELMISMAILLVLSVYLMQMLVNQSRAYAVVDRVTETQQNVRAVAGLLERELRTTGFLAPRGGAICGLDRTDGPDVLFLTDTDAIDNPRGHTELGVGLPVTGSFSGTGGSEAVGLGAMYIDNPTYDSDGTDSDFILNTGSGPSRRGGVIVADRNNPQRGASCGIVQQVGAGSITVDFDYAGHGGHPLDPWDSTTMDPEELVAIPAHVYRIQGGALERDGMVLADDVEDMQVAWFFDEDGDLEEDAPTETPGVDGGPAYDPTERDHAELREVRVSIVARTRAEDTSALQDPGSGQGSFQATFNRDDPGDPPDGFRRRVHTLTVRPRNIGRRPPGSA